MKKAGEGASKRGTGKDEAGVDAFISKVASPEPLPGGGSVAALAGALAAALGEMMAGLTEGREKFSAVQGKVLEIHEKCEALRGELRSLIHEDAAAYRSLLKAIRLPRETESKRAVRAAAIEEAARGATETPLRTARAVLGVLESLKAIIEMGNPNARCDAAVGAQLAYASLKGAQYNILANIRALKDASFAESCRSEISSLLLEGGRILRYVDEMVAPPGDTEGVAGNSGVHRELENRNPFKAGRNSTD